MSEMKTISIGSEEEIVDIEGQLYIWNKSDNTYQQIVLQNNPPQYNSNQQYQDDNKNEVKEVSSDEKRLWSRDAILLLLELIKENDSKFQTHIKKFVWTEIAKIISKNFQIDVTWLQCDSKWKSLSQTYRDTKVYNNTSGHNRKKWKYYDQVDAIMFNKPEINPVATCSSHNGLVENKKEILTDQPKPKRQKIEEKSEKNAENNYQSDFKTKRIAAESIVERRHQEKMQRQDKFLECFSDYLSILRENKKKTNDDEQ